MNFVNKYKRLLSAILLLVYVFVTTPVQWLHYHESDWANEKQLAGNDGILIHSDQDSGQGVDCSICLHKYSSYNNDFFHPLIGSIELESPVITGWVESDYYSSYTEFDNKGPPLVS